MNNLEIEAVLHRARKHIAFESGSVLPGRIMLSDVEDDITFEKLAALADEFHTRLINIDCDHGCSSDPCHSREIIIEDWV